MTGPRSEPPMPIFTMLRIGLPVWPFHRRSERVRKAAILSRTRGLRARHSVPSTTIDAPFAARSATCRTARFSVTLIVSPRNIASMRSPQAAFVRPVAPASRSFHRSRGSSSSRERCPLASAVIRSTALGIVGEELTEVAAAHDLMMRCECLPRGPLGEGWCGGGHHRAPFAGRVACSRAVRRFGCTAPSQKRNPPLKAWVFLPSWQPGGSSLSLFTLPPPSTT